ncbi:TPA: hypothetical protein DIU27_04780 [Candidatus Collierbacteria bacterium]|uniref:Uncharacterized protein n=1 Tax=Candidatus Collierbacteria bacterium GW2011_GWB2_44_22 TaxID=1618387 RepID=A0A0G1KV54_9BACT|nr:MAG: hypothetical protein UW31_C0016G0005 [Candidatus Collierbacteria bacterium GW2011_GWA2_44_13]KKT51779.1 MAG: hypothetical protein UW44_C0008G0101 [Candidatus Collierbacteria bacterium GW2011_GWB2_44_22]KKT65465.1 MAG: hypothetical protein UW58_C0029G0005 [Candidatus Collierbacteria bacterium GW2011_GWC2_44_30]KKT68315.1 MAG: hypothetical protein UW64_C0023G0031 [Microgenomates group bacterium GW2011_GWC1_44_37]KKT88003.1 MAG: hypothetical protein UW88_C0017G0024 [Candidatus Collierbacte
MAELGTAVKLSGGGGKMNSFVNIPKEDVVTISSVILSEMIQMAKTLGVKKGVAFVSIQKQGDETGFVRYRTINNTIQRCKRNPDDRATNYFGVAMEKLAIMMATGLKSGTFKEVKVGETPYRGGLVLVSEKYTVYVGFSGGTEDQDVEIAEQGMFVAELELNL